MGVPHEKDYITLEVIYHNAYEQQPTQKNRDPAPSIHTRAEAQN